MNVIGVGRVLNQAALQAPVIGLAMSNDSVGRWPLKWPKPKGECSDEISKTIESPTYRVQELEIMEKVGPFFSDVYHHLSEAVNTALAEAISGRSCFYAESQGELYGRWKFISESRPESGDCFYWVGKLNLNVSKK